MKFEVVRTDYLPDRTIGKLLIDNVFFCYTLEDKVRPDGIKIYGETAIPEGTYLVTLEPFRGDKTKMYPHLHNVPGFDGICMHGGNVPEDTLGCILLGFGRDDGRIYHSAVQLLVQKLRDLPGPIYVEVKNGY